jgi:hypothetical protein
LLKAAQVLPQRREGFPQSNLAERVEFRTATAAETEIGQKKKVQLASKG